VSAIAAGRIGVAFPGDPDEPSTWSGTPAGVMRGLRDAGVEAVAIRAQPSSSIVRAAALNVVASAYVRPGRDPRAVARRARAAARTSPRLAASETWGARAALRHAGPLDGIVQIGTGYRLATDAPIVTFEDMTVVQVKTHPYLGWDLLSDRAFAARIEQQRRSYERALACCVTSRWAAESVILDYGVPSERVHVVGLGRNHDVPAAPDRDWSTPRFLFVGIDWARKNGDGVLRAFGALRREIPAATLDVVGAHPTLSAPGVTGHGVLRLGVPDEQDRLHRLFGRSTCFVMPSHAEAVGIAYVEAGAAGLPSIGTSRGGSDFLIGDGGLIVDPDDDESLLASMRYLAEPETAAHMGGAAKRRAELFTWTAVGRRLLRALEGAPAEPVDTPLSV
jgi:glycosyltransferase involved in cell wall biosynthesis